MRGTRRKKLRKLLGVKRPGRRYGGTVGVSKHAPEAIVFERPERGWTGAEEPNE